MCCWSEKTTSILIAIISIVFMLTSGATIYLMHRVRIASHVWDLQADPLQGETGESQVSIEAIKLIIYWGVLGLCGFTILIGLLGLVTARFKGCCSISLYSFFTLILFLAFTLIGVIMICVTIAANQQLDQYCEW